MRSLPPETAAAYRQHQFHATFSVLLTILVHIVTVASASPFLIARKHAMLPRIGPRDFSTMRAAGFLLIPFFNLYWVFVLYLRTVERLTLQTQLWGVGSPPSRGLAATVATFSAVSGIPYVGVPFALVAYLFVWPLFLAQIQATCNRLALAASPQELHSSMLDLERWTRLRWLGWMLVTPSFITVTGGLAMSVMQPAAERPELIAAVTIFAVVAGVGGALVYSGSRNTHDMYDQLYESAPQLVAGYLRIDKNAAWAACWIAGAVALLSVGVGAGILIAPTEEMPLQNAWSAFGQAGGLVVLIGYAVWKALGLKRQIAWLEDAPPPAYDAEPQTP